MTQQSITVTVTGPLFQGKAPAVIQAAITGTIREVTDMANDHLADMLRPRPAGVYLSRAEGGRSTGHYRRNLHQEVRQFHGRVHDSGVIYGRWLEGTSSRNRSTRFRGYASFRRTKDWLEPQVPRITAKWSFIASKQLGG